MSRGRGSGLGELRLGIRRIFCHGFRRFLVGQEREVVVVAAAAAVVAGAAAAAVVVVSVDSLLLWWVPPGALCLELVVQPVGLPVVLRPGLTHVAPALELVDWLLSEALEHAVGSARSRAKLTAWAVLPRSARHYTLVEWNSLKQLCLRAVELAPKLPHSILGRVRLGDAAATIQAHLAMRRMSELIGIELGNRVGLTLVAAPPASCSHDAGYT